MKSYQVVGFIALLTFFIDGCGSVGQTAGQPAASNQTQNEAGSPNSNASGSSPSNASTNHSVSNSAGSSSNQTASGQTASTVTAASGDYGWKFVDLQSVFGKDVTIDGLSRTADGKIKVSIRHDILTSDGGLTFSKTGYTGIYDPSTNQIRKTTSFTKTQSQMQQESPLYHGAVSLKFPLTFPTKFQTQSVRVMENGKSVATWPKSIPLYGSAANPQSSAPGALDTIILGQSGNYLWLALKGPQYPPLYPNQGPLLFSFRYWNRLVALNLQNSSAVEFTIPRTYSLYQEEVSSTISLVNPSFVTDGSNVWVGVGNWMGKFPANPGTNLQAGRVTKASTQTLVKPQRNYVQSQETIMKKDLKSDEQREAESLASYWNSVIGASVPGVPPFKNFQNGTIPTWNTQPVIFNHGALPSDIIWAMEFPLSADDPFSKQRTSIESGMFDMLTSPLNLDAIGIIPKTNAQVSKQFHGKPPISLPGYHIKNNAYWPK